MASTEPSTRRSMAVFFGLAALVLVLDQATKFLAVEHLTFAFESVDAQSFTDELRAWVTVDHPAPKTWTSVVDAFWNHRYVENPGAVWSFAAGWPAWLRKPFFLALTPIAVVLLVLYRRRLGPNQKLLGVALALILGGALGNYMDRLTHGYVIDFIDWHWNDMAWMKPQLHFPTFNVADAGITSGVSLVLLDGVFDWFRARRQGARSTDDSAVQRP